jgi:hypothetical protein
MKEPKRWMLVATYAAAMAWVESAVVFYLRKNMNRIDPYQTNPFPDFMGISHVEIVREAATLIMLLMVGFLAGTNSRSRWGYAAIAFGVWDIFYYVFLKVICDWPNSLLSWDVLFLIPLPWWGPVIAPVLIAVLMIAWGTLATQGDHGPRRFRTEWRPWLVNSAGIALALYVFMADAIRVADQGALAVRNMLPVSFNWSLFGVALALMCAPVVDLSWKLRRKNLAVQSQGLNQGATA